MLTMWLPSAGHPERDEVTTLGKREGEDIDKPLTLTLIWYWKRIDNLCGNASEYPQLHNKSLILRIYGGQ